MQRDWLMDYCRAEDGFNQDNGKLLEEVLAQAERDPELTDAIGALYTRFDTHESFTYQLAQERLTDDGLKRLEESQRCSIGIFGDEIPCENETHWSFNNFPLCVEHLREMGDMNSDNFEAVKEALQEASTCQS